MRDLRFSDDVEFSPIVRRAEDYRRNEYIPMRNIEHGSEIGSFLYLQVSLLIFESFSLLIKF